MYSNLQIAKANQGRLIIIKVIYIIEGHTNLFSCFLESAVHQPVNVHWQTFI